MLHAGLDLSRNRIDVCLLSEHGELLAEFATPSDGDGVCALARRVLKRGEPVRAVIESMNGARFVHDRLEQLGLDVLIADAQKVKGLAPLACKTDRDRLLGHGRALAPRSGARDLAARSRGARRA